MNGFPECESESTSDSARLVRRPLKLADLVAATLAATACLLAGCTVGPGEHGSNPVYPLHLRQHETLNIQVTRDVTRITLTNTTANPFAESRLWLNGSYSAPLEALEIGETVTLNLNDFVNEHGEPFRAGGFFAAEQPDVLVLAQLEVDNPRRLLGLIVVDGRAE